MDPDTAGASADPSRFSAIGAAMAMHHVGIAVWDLDAAVAFYTSELGLVEAHREINEDQQITEVMLDTAMESTDSAPPTRPAHSPGPDADPHAAGATRTEPLEMAGDPDPGSQATSLSAANRQAQLQLLAPTSTDSAIARFLDRSGPGIHHIAYRVADLAAASERLRRQDVQLVYDTGRPGTLGSLINFIHPRDAGGPLIELVQPRGIAR